MHIVKSSIIINYILKVTKNIYHVKAISPHPYLTIFSCTICPYSGTFIKVS